MLSRPVAADRPWGHLSVPLPSYRHCSLLGSPLRPWPISWSLTRGPERCQRRCHFIETIPEAWAWPEEDAFKILSRATLPCSRPHFRGPLRGAQASCRVALPSGGHWQAQFAGAELASTGVESSVRRMVQN